MVSNKARRKRVSVDVNGDARAEHSNGESDDADDEGTEQRVKFRHRRPEEYTNARSKLKLASALSCLGLRDRANADFRVRSLRVLSIARHA